MKSGTEITAQRAREFNLKPQGKGETDLQFRDRVSGALREMGHIVEAHEAYNNALYDTDPTAMIGILGASAQAFRGRDYNPTNGQSQVGDDIASGVLAQAPEDNKRDLLAVLAVLLGK